MPCNNCAFIRVVFFRELYFKEMCGSAETTQKSKRSRSHIPAKHVVLHIKKQLRRVSGAEERNQHKHHADWMKQLRRVSGVNNYHKILTIII